MARGRAGARGAQDDKSGHRLSVMDELCGGGKLGVGFSPPAFINCCAFMPCHPERAFCAKDLCSWGAATEVDGRGRLKRDITLSSLRRAVAFAAHRIARGVSKMHGSFA